MDKDKIILKNRIIKQSGTSAHVIVPKKFLGLKAEITIIKKEYIDKLTNEIKDEQ